MTKKDPYEILGVNKNASDEDIKKAYKKLAMETHPDKNKSADTAERFREVTEAYSILKDPEKKKEYDNPHPFYQRESYSSPYKRKPYGFSWSPGPDVDDIFAEMIKNFDYTIKKEKHPYKPLDGDDLKITLKITLEEVSTGTKKKIRYQRYVKCDSCAFSVPYSTGCSKCGGRGRFLNTVEEDITILPGVDQDQNLTFYDLGHCGVLGGKNGSLIVSINIMDSETFKRHNSDLHTDLKILPHEAVLGTQIEVTGIFGEIIKIVIPAGTSSGKFFRVPKKGLPVLNSRLYGDLIIKVLIIIPEMTSIELQLYKTIKEIHDKNIHDIHQGVVSDEMYK